MTKAEIEAFEKGIQSDVGMDENTEDALRLPYDRSYEIPRKNLVIGRNTYMVLLLFNTLLKLKNLMDRYFQSFGKRGVRERVHGQS